MYQHMTVLEASVQWGVAAGTVQHLCREGKVKGAVKRAGSWFIPNDAPNPLKNSKSIVENFNYIGTRKKIFDRAIELFALHGFESVSIKDIADAVEIMQSSIYNHFPSKQKILDTIYDYYTEYFSGNQKPIEEMKELLINSTKEEFCSALMFTFESESEDKYKRMILITKIIYMRFYQDDRARDIFLNLMNASVEEYVIKILDYGISMGVIKDFDMQTYAKFIVGQRHIMGMKAFAHSSYEPKQLDEEIRIIKMCADMLPFAT